MRWAKKYFADESFSIEDKSRTECYDLICTRGREKLFVEVKGTRSLGGSAVLTRNEVAHAKTNGQVLALFVMHSVKVSGAKHPKVTGGKHRVLRPWGSIGGFLTTPCIRLQASQALERVTYLSGHLWYIASD